MSTQASLTNQRLDVARRFLTMTAEEAWMGAAYENAALFHLQSAATSLLQEIKEEYSLLSKPDINALVEEAKGKGVRPPILAELIELVTKKESWLNQLHNAYQASLQCSLNSLSYKNDNIISSSSSGIDVGFSYLNALTDIILRFREESVEY